MSTNSPAALQPEQPPAFARRIRIRGARAAGLALLLAIPVLALFQLFGDRRGSDVVRAGDVVLKVEYPESARFGKRTRIRLEVSDDRKKTGRPVLVEVPASYLGHFDEIDAFPEAGSPTARGYAFQVPLSPEGLAAPLFVSLMPAEYGWARGSIRVVADGREASLPLETLVFP